MAALLALSGHDTAAQYDRLWRIYLPTLGVVGGLVAGAIVVACLRFRRRGDGWPEQTHSAPKLEIIYLGVIALIVAGLLVATFRTEGHVDALTAHPALVVRVVASQWQWEFDYPRSGIRQVAHDIASAHPRYARLVVPAGEPVEFRLRSVDVLHNFFIPAMRFKRYAFPNYTNRFVLTFPHPGHMLGQCAQFCGWDHAEMRFLVTVLPPARFRTWVAAHGGGAAG
jgi:cytochrome c oxidase subunit II